MLVTTIRDAAMDIIKANWEAEPGIRTTYVFPSTDLIRIVHLDENSPALKPDEDIAPFYFPAPRGGGSIYGVAVALISPGDQHKNKPPQGWGDWNDAERIDRTE